MAEKNFLKILLWVVPAPLHLLSIFLEYFAPKGFLSDLEKCVSLTESLGALVPPVFIKALVLAEDHRNSMHPGVDVIAMYRALWIRICHGKMQGASTIEQQYVRVVTGRYERTKSRKLREQLLALMLVRRVPKSRIASAYLATAFYGSGLVGIGGLQTTFGKNLECVSFLKALEMVAQLKYPRPLDFCDSWQVRLTARIVALKCLGSRCGIQFPYLDAQVD